MVTFHRQAPYDLKPSTPQREPVSNGVEAVQPTQCLRHANLHELKVMCHRQIFRISPGSRILSIGYMLRNPIVPTNHERVGALGGPGARFQRASDDQLHPRVCIDVFTACAERETGSELADHAERLIDSTKNLQMSLAQSSAQVRTADDKRLASLAGKCLEAGNTLDMELKKLAVDPVKSRRRDKLSKTFRTLWNRGGIDNLEKNMRQCSETLNTGLLLRIWLVSISSLSHPFHNAHANAA